MCKSAWARHVVLSVLVFSSFAALTSAAPLPQRTGTAKTMDEVVDRVIANENRLNAQISQYSPLVETYIQNLKPDKDLGYTPAGDKYFLGRAQFTKGVELVSLSDTGGKGKNLHRHREFFLFRHAVPSRRLPADDFHRHQRLR